MATVTAAFGVGVVYATGALYEATRLHGAHVQVSDTLPLFPLPDLLAIGITVGVKGFALLITIVALVALVVWSGSGGEVSLLGRLPAPRSGVQRWVLFGALGIGLVVSFFSAPPVTGLGYVASWTGGAVSGFYAGRGQRRRSLMALCAAYVALIGINLVGDYVHPQPLPVATAIETDGTVVSGALLLHADGVWYLSPSADHVIGVEDANARSVELRLRPRAPQRSLARLVWDLIR